MSEEVLDQLGAIYLALPEASEGSGVGNPPFRLMSAITAGSAPGSMSCSIGVSWPR